MIGLDTNILIRYVVKDDPVNGPKASQIMASLTARNPGWISITAIEQEDIVRSALDLSRSGLGDFSDCPVSSSENQPDVQPL